MRAQDVRQILVVSLLAAHAAFMAAPAAGQVQMAPGQRPPFQNAVEGLLDAIADPTPDRVRAFADAYMTPAFRDSESLESHVARLRELRATLGRAQLGDLLAPSPSERIANVRSGVNGEAYRLRFQVSQEMPPKIAGIALERDVPGAAAPPQGPPPAVTPAIRRDVLDRLYEAIENQYVSADTGRLISSHVKGRAAAGAYDALIDPVEFGRAITADLRATSGDLHLSLRPANTSGGARRPGEPSPRFGFERVERLPGNVGYIEVRGVLGGADQAFDIAAEALRSIDGTDAVILDMRDNPGAGSSPRGSILVYLLSHFLPPRTHILSTYQRATGQTTEVRTMDDVGGPRRVDVPLYVLIGPGTASGGEYIAFALQSQGRATVIGERSAGAGRMVTSVPLAHGFVAGVSVNRTWSPATGSGWEISGVIPDVQVPAADALNAALRMIGRGK